MKTITKDVTPLATLSLLLLAVGLGFCTIAALSPSWLVADIHDHDEEHLVRRQCKELLLRSVLPSVTLGPHQPRNR